MARKLKLEKPIQDYTKSGFDSNLLRTNVLSKNSTTIDRNDMASQETKTFDLFDKRTLRVNKIATTKITLADFQASVGFSATRYRKTITHNAGYNPVFLAFFKRNSESYYSPVPFFDFFFGGSGYAGFEAVNGWTTKTQLNFDLFIDAPYAGDFPYTVKYYILREEIPE